MREVRDMEYSEKFTDKNGTEVEIKMKTECLSSVEIREALRFMAESSRKFYLRVAEKVNSKPSEVQPSLRNDHRRFD